jgi:hypothetical protein
MASASEDAVENALSILVSVTEKSGNLRSNLKKGILKAVRSLKKEFANLRSIVEYKSKRIVDLEMKAEETNSILQALLAGAGNYCRGDQDATPLGLQANSKDTDWTVAHSVGGTRKRYSDAVEDRRPINVPHVNLLKPTGYVIIFLPLLNKCCKFSFLKCFIKSVNSERDH